MYNNYRFQLTTAVTWRIVSEILRRHHEKKALRIYELHPCDGLYDCLRICVGGPSTDGTLCDFNQQSQHIHACRFRETEALRFGWPKQDPKDYVSAFLDAEDPKEIIGHVEHFLGLTPSKYIPTTTAPVLTFRVIAGLLERYAFSRERVDVRMSLLDTSAYGGGGLREGLKLFPGKFSEVRSQPEKQYKRAERLWLALVNGDSFSDGKTKALLDLRGIVYFVDKPETEWNIHEEYQQNGRKLRPILNRLEEGVWS